MNVLVYGLGRSGLAVCKLLTKQGHSFMTYDDHAKDLELDTVKRLGGRPLATLEAVTADICIAAPGVPFNHATLEKLRSQNIETIGEVEWVYRTIHAPLIGVTGTAGKTSVTRWLSDVLVSSGLDAVAGGNIDPALSAVAEEGKLLVTELSSFQLERCPTLKPSIAIALNLSRDHIDRHGNLEAYQNAKKAIMVNQSAEDIFIYNADDPNLCAWAQESQAKTLAFSVNHKADAHLEQKTDSSVLVLHGKPLLATSELSVQGKHQYANALAIALAANALGVSQQDLSIGLKAFKGVEGRYAVAGKLGKITFIEDSIATRSLAVKAALESSPSPVVWIAGGADKGASFDDLNALIKERVSLFVGIGESGAMFAKQAAKLTQTTLCSEPQGLDALRCAANAGVKHLEEQHAGQGTVLLAPLAASFDQFKDYKERAYTFRQVVNEMQAA